MTPNPLVRLAFSVIAVGVLLFYVVYDHLKLLDCQEELQQTVNSLRLTTSNLNKCVDAREGDLALVNRAVTEAEKSQGLLKAMISEKERGWEQATNMPVETAFTWQTNATFLIYTNRADLVNLSRNGTNILTVDPNFNVLVHGTKIGHITETNWMPKP